MLLKSAIEIFLNNYQNQGTKDNYLYCLRPMRNYIGPEKPLKNIRPVELVEYVQTLHQNNYSHAYINKNIKSIKRFFNWCVEVDELPISPAHSIHTVKIPSKIDKQNAMSDAELEKILEYVKWKPRDYALILFLADTGCRAGGAANLKIDDIDFENMTAIVTEKGKKTRPVFFGRRCSSALQMWLLKRPSTAGLYIFQGYANRQTPLKSENIGQIVRRACDRVGVRQGLKRGSHTLRHRKGHQLADSRVAPTTAARALGHDSEIITMKHYYPDDYDRVENALRELTYDSTSDKTIINLPKAKSI